MFGAVIARTAFVCCVVVFACLISQPASAAECFGNIKAELKEPALCSRIVEFSGACGHANYSFPGWPDVAVAAAPWEAVPIRIVAVSADAVVRAKWHTVTGSIFAGDSFNNDPLTPLTYATAGISDLHGNVSMVLHTAQHFPAGVGMQLPAVGPPLESTHLDVHITCDPVGASYTGNLSVWYVLDGPNNRIGESPTAPGTRQEVDDGAPQSRALGHRLLVTLFCGGDRR